MDLGIAGRSAIVCASSKGLGKGCAMALAENGVNVVINGRDEAALEETAREIREKTGAEVTPVAADVSTPEGQRALLAVCPKPDILINNNGGPPRRSYKEIDREAMIEGVIMNMITPIELIQAVIDHMSEQKFGRIVNITSASVRQPLEGLDLSSGARAGLTAFLAGVCRTVADRNVTINHLLPGAFDTERLRSGLRQAAKERGVSEEEMAAMREKSIPAGRFGQPDEFGQTCAFLCSVHAGYITGQNILIDGGAFNGTF
ncbi:MAG: SDR family oxidoreductase [Alphaproteobacteria bacterium]|nr:MAG: SDR family oxidoreductase [Alphaproteobacteria bacterium]